MYSAIRVAVHLDIGSPPSTRGGVSNVGINGKNALQSKAIGVVIATVETLPDKRPTGPRH